MSYHDDPTERGWTDAEGQRWTKPPRQEPQRVPTFFVHMPDEPQPPASRTLRLTGSTIAWSAWILFGVTFELWALLSGHVKSTLSWKWWSVFRVRQQVPVWLRIALTVPQLVFIGWLLVHLPFGWLSF